MVLQPRTAAQERVASPCISFTRVRKKDAKPRSMLVHVTATASKQRENDRIYSSSRHAASKQALHIHRVHTQPIVPFYVRNVTNNKLVIPLKKGNLQGYSFCARKLPLSGRSPGSFCQLRRLAARTPSGKVDAQASFTSNAVITRANAPRRPRRRDAKK